MIAKSLEDLQVFQQALEAADAISAILDRPGFRHEPELRNQIAGAATAFRRSLAKVSARRRIAIAPIINTWRAALRMRFARIWPLHAVSAAFPSPSATTFQVDMCRSGRD